MLTALIAIVAMQLSTTQPTATNPILPDGADPHAVVVGHTVWIYPTFYLRGGGSFLAFKSDDLLSWKRVGPVLRFADVKWIEADGQKRHEAWAPCMIEKDGKFYFYYSVGDQTVTPSRIGVAVASSPAGAVQRFRQAARERRREGQVRSDRPHGLQPTLRTESPICTRAAATARSFAFSS